MDEKLKELYAGEMSFDPKGRFYRAIFNDIGLAERRLPESVILKDDTIREGEETPGVNLTVQDKLRVTERLIDAGIRQMEVGFGGAILEHTEFSRALRQSGMPVVQISHIRAASRENEWQKELEIAREAGADMLSFVGQSPCMIRARTPWTTPEQTPQIAHSRISYAKKLGAKAAYGIADLPRNRIDRVIETYKAAIDAGADRLYVYDSVGCGTPEATTYLVRMLRALCQDRCEIALHTHNVFGLSLACGLAGIQAGAKVIDVIVNGMGDTTGQAALEEVVAALTVLYGIDTGVDLAKLYPLSQFITEIYKVPVAPTKPIVGENVFRYAQHGHMVSALKGDWFINEVMRAEALGRERSIEFGPLSLTGGDGPLMVKARLMGYQPADEELEPAFAQLRGILKVRPFATEADVEGILRSCLGDPPGGPVR